MSFLDASKGNPEIDSGELTGQMYHIACKSWCTSGGQMTPLSFKVKDDGGNIVGVNDIKVLSREEKNYVGVVSKEFQCEALIGGFIRNFKLVYYCESCLWVMVI